MGTARDNAIWDMRALFYSAMHAIFSGEPSCELLETLASQGCMSSFRTLSKHVPEIDRICDYLERCDVCGLEKAVESAQADYNRVMLGFGKRISHPWESAYTSVTGLLFREETLAVREAYLEQGLEAQRYMNVADDHIALECEFMARLARKTGMELSAGRDAKRLETAQSAFIEEHLAKWVGPYAIDVAQDAPDSLYARASEALASFVQWDSRQLA